MKFDEIELKPEVRKALAEMKYTDLTPVQELTFPHVLAGKDVLARAETGSGKTSACGIPLIQNIDPENDRIQALICVPTRELALQYVDEIARIAKHCKIMPFAVFGGMPIDIQKAKLNHGVHVLVATPGRLIDLLYNSELSLSGVKTVVLDEADEMLKMGFIDDVNFIMSCLIQEHQTLFFSATMPPAITHLVNQYLKDPVLVELNKDQIAPSSLEHYFDYVSHNQRLERMEAYLDNNDVVQAIIFCNSRTGGEKLLGKLKKKFDSVEFIHGGIDQARRTSIYNRFKRKEIKFMVATDIASRGLDFSHVTHVINYDFPRYHEIYTHRTGRTGRMGRTGKALTYITEREKRTLRDMLKVNHIEPKWLDKEPDLDNIKKSSGSGKGPGHGKGRRSGRRPQSRR